MLWYRDDLGDKLRRGERKEASIQPFFFFFCDLVCCIFLSLSAAMSLYYVMPPCSGADQTKCSVRILDAVKALAVLLW